MDGLYADLASPKHRPYFILALPSLIQKSKEMRNKPIKKKKKPLTFLHSIPTRLQTTQYVSNPSPSSNAVIDIDMLKTILLIVLGLLLGLTSMTLLIFHRRRRKPPASCNNNKLCELSKSNPVSIS